MPSFAPASRPCARATTIDLRPALGLIGCPPVRVVTGVDDGITTPEDAPEVVEHLPAGLVRFVPVEGAPHDVFTEVADLAPDTFAASWVEAV